MTTDNGEMNMAQSNAAGQIMPVGAIPTVGRMVHYMARGSADGVFPKVPRAAVVTDVRPLSTEDSGQLHEVRLCVMNPEGLFFTAWLRQGQEGGQWDWMPFQKDQQARLAAGTADVSHKS